MKTKIIYLFFVFLATNLFSGCSEDELNGTSTIKDSQREENEFDSWLIKNLIDPYNIEIKYRMEDIESDASYNLTPANYEKSIQLTKLIDFLCLKVYDEATGSQSFIRSHFPKLIHYIGSPAYQNNGSMVLGNAEGGLKITLYNVNKINVANIEELNNSYFHIIHHEFSHILHQTIPYPSEFKEITGNGYIKDSWSITYNSSVAALQSGFITPYASSAAEEDFVELISIYITNTSEEWNSMISKAGTNGSKILNTKFEIVYNYMKNSWNIDLNQLREIILRNEKDVNKLNLNQL